MNSPIDDDEEDLKLFRESLSSFVPESRRIAYDDVCWWRSEIAFLDLCSGRRRRFGLEGELLLREYGGGEGVEALFEVGCGSERGSDFVRGEEVGVGCDELLEIVDR